MGAVPGGRLLNGAAPSPWFDVGSFRSSPRTVVLRRAGHAALVLGSTQRVTSVDSVHAARAGIEVVRRRSGGGAVLVGPGDPLWVDVWLPRGDPLWHDDVVHAPEWVGEWWASTLRGAGAGGLAVHRGSSIAVPWSDVICFAGVGPGEVVAGGRKVVGVAQWRCREGALFHSCAYRRWDPRPLVDLIDLRPVVGTVRPADEAGRPADDSGALRTALVTELSQVAAGFETLAEPSFGVAALLDRLPPGPGWDIRTG